MSFKTISLRPIAGAIGAEVDGVDFSSTLPNLQSEEIHQAFLDHQVLVFRNQSLTPQRQVEVARLFGKPAIYPFLKGLDEAPEVNVVAKAADDERNFGGSWHSDTAYKEHPDIITLLYGVQVPPAGGDTLFANLYQAYDALSDGMKAMLEGLHAWYSSEKGYGGNRAAQMKSIKSMQAAVASEIPSFESRHPVVRTHPGTGRKSLYISRSHTLRFDDMTVEESNPLINWLADHAAKPEFTCRVRWQPRTLTVWDNRCTNHFAIDDFAGESRRMHRVTIEGDRPV